MFYYLCSVLVAIIAKMLEIKVSGHFRPVKAYNNHIFSNL